MNDTLENIIRPESGEAWAPLQDMLDEVMELSNLAKWEEAVTLCRDAMQKFPYNPEPYFMLAIVAYYLGDEGQAIKTAETAHEMDPETREYADLLATVSARVGRLTDAVYYGKIAETCEPHSYLTDVVPLDFKDLKLAFEEAKPSHHNVNGQRFFNEIKFEAALKEFKAEISLNPENVEALLFLARTALTLGSDTQALGAAQSALHHEPDNGMARALMARALVCLGRDAEAIDAAKEAIRLADGDADIYQMAMYALQLCPLVSVAELKAAADGFEQEFVEVNEVEEPDDVPVSGRQVRIGMMSNAFYSVPHMDYVAGWFAVPPDSAAQIRGLQYSIIRDAVTTLCKNGTTEWREIYGVDPFTLDLTLRHEELDVLVDLSRIDGETCGSIPGLRPASKRIGVTALPEPGMMPGITHILTDETMASAEQNVLRDGQELLTISGTLFARMPFKTLRQDSASPVVEQGTVTFGARAGFPEMSSRAATLIARVLHEVPNSRLYLFGAHDTSEQARVRIREQFMDHGVIDRIYFVDDDDSDELEDQLQRLETSISGLQWAEVDVFLDTYPLNGRRETFEALWSGVPVVTRRGARRASSVGASIITAAGHPEWVAQSDDAYVDIAVELVRDSDALAKTRASLQASISQTLAFNPGHAAREVRRALVDVATKGK